MVRFHLLYFSVHVLFFKQKTAYEMRISDWSSDVCSSDLMIFAQPLLLLGIAAVLTVWAYVIGMWRRRGDYLRHDGVTLYRGASARWPLALEIGRASCRGSACQYV